MKMNLKSLSMAVSVFMVVSSATSAFAVDASYNPADSSLSVTGSNVSADIAVAVMPYRYSADKLTADIINTNDSVVFWHISAGGDYSEEILLPLNLSLGKYRVSEIIGGKTTDTVFFKFSKSGLINAISGINNADMLSEAVSVIESLISDFDLTLKTKASDIADFMYNNIPDSGYNEDNFPVFFSLYEGFVSLDREEINFDTFMEEYSSFMQKDTLEGYNTLTAEQKKAVADIAKDIEFKGKSASEIGSEITFVSKVKLCGNYDYLKDTVIEYCENNGIDLNDYEDLSEYEKNNIFIEMFGVRNNFKSADDITETFNEYVADASDNYSSNSGGSSGGSSGGGGSKGSVSGGGYQVGNSAVTSVPVEQPVKTFKDISGHWAKNEIEKLYSAGIISGTGDGIFEPDRYVTRAEFVKMLLGALGITEGNAKVSFEDVTNDSWYYKYVSTAVEHGFVNGISDTVFAPDNKITREDAATMVYRAVTSKLTAYSDNSFVDSDLISSYATTAVKALADAEILKGSDGYFRPKADITRAEAAALLLRIYNLK